MALTVIRLLLAPAMPAMHMRAFMVTMPAVLQQCRTLLQP